MDPQTERVAKMAAGQLELARDGLGAIAQNLPHNLRDEHYTAHGHAVRVVLERVVAELDEHASFIASHDDDEIRSRYVHGNEPGT